MIKEKRLEIRLTDEEKNDTAKATMIAGHTDLSKYIRETINNRNKRLIARSNKKS